MTSPPPSPPLTLLCASAALYRAGNWLDAINTMACSDSAGTVTTLFLRAGGENGSPATFASVQGFNGASASFTLGFEQKLFVSRFYLTANAFTSNFGKYGAEGDTGRQVTCPGAQKIVGLRYAVTFIESGDAYVAGFGESRWLCLRAKRAVHTYGGVHDARSFIRHFPTSLMLTISTARSVAAGIVCGDGVGAVVDLGPQTRPTAIVSTVCPPRHAVTAVTLLSGDELDTIVDLTCTLRDPGGAQGSSVVLPVRVNNAFAVPPDTSGTDAPTPVPTATPTMSPDAILQVQPFQRLFKFKFAPLSRPPGPLCNHFNNACPRHTLSPQVVVTGRDGLPFNGASAGRCSVAVPQGMTTVASNFTLTVDSFATTTASFGLIAAAETSTTCPPQQVFIGLRTLIIRGSPPPDSTVSPLYVSSIGVGTASVVATPVPRCDAWRDGCTGRIPSAVTGTTEGARIQR
ncbi:hypothetical protein JKP88DRAFT_250411 [Tribonema minus]|uniref:Uncharacterized protein n=1 Tax=Tribonema minus TaxID=303371 RepID=A0A835YIJ2_9STRA|nr:hypothetical protein JKP88DRAFT_250411 [Tribonema minus]